ncbi:DNA ligase, ATP-dependent, C-terminal, partial [Dillenia turbinata]
MYTNPTVTLNSSDLFIKSLSQHQNQAQSLPNLNSLPPIPSDFPQSKLIPRTRFVIDGFKFAGDYSFSYFLSHFHSDHYTGLSPNWRNGIIFCSHITSRLLIDVLGLPSLFIVPLKLCEPVLIDGSEVVLVDANHCPGAVQFLVRVSVGEGKFERYVHTGDFRYSKSMKLEPLLKKFVGSDAVFLDTTYCNPKFVFPSQEESIDYIVNVIERIRNENAGSEKSVLFLVATYVIGKERILLEISRKCGCKIHVDGRKQMILQVLGFGESGVFTADENASSVHVVSWNVLGETWPYFRPNFLKMKEIMTERGYSRVVGFVPTGWTYEVKHNKFSIRTKDSFEIHLVPYSEHSNYDELREYVKFLKPKCVVPTVGVDIEKLDSKHANKMRKYFVGLVDEMANKKDFLMGFHRGSCDLFQTDETSTSIETNKGLDQEEGKSKENIEKNADREIVLDSSASLGKTGALASTLLKDNKEDDIIQELRDCLPGWVTEEQILNLLKNSEGNVIEAVSNFYERETEFHEQAGANHTCSFSPQITPVNDTASICKPVPFKDPIFSAPRSEDPKSPKTKRLTVNSISPAKRRKTTEGKVHKKTSAKSNLQPSGSKQSMITSFFVKIQPNMLQDDDNSVLSIQHLDEKSLPGGASDHSYKQEVDQFIQIINGNESLRCYAATLLEKTKGDINMALDIYYNKPGRDTVENEGSLELHRSIVQDQPCTVCSTDQEQDFPDTACTLDSSANFSSTSVSLPPEKYYPTEHACWREGQPAPYLHLARTFELLEAERGKIKATSMLCNMFRSLLALSPEDVLPAIYLCTNKIAADHENIELNIGGSLVTSALEEACGTSRSKIREMYNILGDLGDVAQLCRQAQSLLVPPSALLVRDVFSVLRKISVQTGSGSMVRKKGLIVNLMCSCREKEMKFLVRTLVRNLRIGAMMRTVLPALAQAVVMNSNPDFVLQGTADHIKEKLQSLSVAVIEAYNIVPNLDVLVPSLMSKGLEFSSSTLSMVPGVPIKPMLAKITNGVPEALKLLDSKAFTCEYKYDGQRAQIHKLVDGSVRVFSRNGEESTSRFPDVVDIIKQSCKAVAVSFIVDAEVVAIDRKNGFKLMSFQELSSRGRGSRDSLITVGSIKVDVCVFVFDIMFANGQQLLSFPLRERRKYLKNLFNDEVLGYFEYAKETTVEADDASLNSEGTMTKINCFLEEALRFSCEGIMVKTLDADSGYSPSKRADSWLKVKRDYVEGLNDSLDLVPIGAWHGNGRKAGWYSPFLMACYNPDTEEFQSVCRVMSGFSDSFYMEMKEFYAGDKILSKKPPYYQTAEVPDMWFSPELVWEIRGADFTVSPVHHAAIGLVHPSRGISVRFPRFIRMVSDRKPDECSTATDIAEMFHSQPRKMEKTVSTFINLPIFIAFINSSHCDLPLQRQLQK